MEIYSFIANNLSGTIIKIQCHTHQGFPRFNILFDNPQFNEKRCIAFVRTALREQKFKLPADVITLSIEPGTNARETSNIYSAICLALICNKLKSNKKILISGTIDLNGNFIKNSFDEEMVIKKAIEHEIDIMIFPKGREISTERQNCFYANNIFEIYDIVKKEYSKKEKNIFKKETPSKEIINPFYDIIGLDNAKIAMCIAVAGRLNFLLCGPRGCGKSLLLSRLNLLFESDEETEKERKNNISVLNNYKIDNVTFDENPSCDNTTLHRLLKYSPSSPPEIIKYHGRYLITDEMKDLDNKDLSYLKFIIEKGNIETKKCNYPLKIFLASAINPCPCGNLGLKRSTCSCKSVSIQKHWSKLKNTILSNYQLVIPMTCADFENAKVNDYTYMINKIACARKMQIERHKKNSGKILYNSDIVRYGLKTEQFMKVIPLLKECDNTREMLNIYSIARTIADMEKREEINEQDIKQASLLYMRDAENIFIK